MQAQTLNCPMCGAAAATDANHCQHCGARLATVACPSCFGLVFLGAKFCSHCGAKVDRVEQDPAKPRLCPRCRVDLGAVTLGTVHVLECPRCAGLWVDNDTLQQLCANQDKQASILGNAAVSNSPSSQTVEQVRYVPCPICKELMHRVNFGHCSSVVVDVCRTHGTWFDCDELRRVVEFIRAGGLDKARAKEFADLKEQEWRFRHAALDNYTPPPAEYSPNEPVLSQAVSALAGALVRFIGYE